MIWAKVRTSGVGRNAYSSACNAFAGQHGPGCAQCRAYRSHETATTALDFVRYLLIAVATAYATFLIWRWSWIAAVAACVPVYIIMLNAVDFLTLPLYTFTGVRRAKAAEKALWKSFENEKPERKS